VTRFPALDFFCERKTGADDRRILQSVLFREIVMALLRIGDTISRAAVAAGAVVSVMSWTSAAVAAQGPGSRMGAASHFTQMAMAVLVYGALAIIVGIGLIGAARRR
jgi:hypothetical protein